MEESSPKSERGFVIRVTSQDCYLLDFIYLFCRFSYLHLQARGVCMRISQLGTKEGWWDHSADKGAAGHQAWEPEFSLVRLMWQKGRLDPWKLSSSLLHVFCDMPTYNKSIKQISVTEELTQWLRVYATLAKGWSSVPSTQARWLKTALKPARPAISGFLWHLHTWTIKKKNSIVQHHLPVPLTTWAT